MVERKTAAVGVGICSVLAMAAGAALYRRERSIAVSQLEIKAAVTAPLRVVHLSDLHGRVFGKGNQRLLSKILSCGPDLIVVTGNLVGANPSDREIRQSVSLLRGLSDYAPVFFVCGGQEHQLKDLQAFLGTLRRSGVTVLQNEMVSLQVGEQQVTVLGLEEYPESSDLHGLLRDFELQDGFRLLLCSAPDGFFHNGQESYQNFYFDLMLSGRGQRRESSFSFQRGEGLRFQRRQQTYGEMPKLVVSRGLSNGGTLLSHFHRSEIVCVFVAPVEEQQLSAVPSQML